MLASSRLRSINLALILLHSCLSFAFRSMVVARSSFPLPSISGTEQMASDALRLAHCSLRRSIIVSGCSPLRTSFNPTCSIYMRGTFLAFSSYVSIILCTTSVVAPLFVINSML
uniref:Secreted protein n=1 Tax=Ixodes ricinus TaxID=34613 RepID=A0A147BKX7_IXORI